MSLLENEGRVSFEKLTPQQRIQFISMWNGEFKERSNVELHNDREWIQASPNFSKTCIYRIISPNLTGNKTPFGLLDESIKQALQRAFNGAPQNEGSNIEFYHGDGTWKSVVPLWRSQSIYRVAPSTDVEINIMINGKKAKLSDISEGTLLNIRKHN